MPHPLRLTAHFIDDTTAHFQAIFPAAEADAPGCAPAQLKTGDGTTLDLGLLCPPTGVNWFSAHTVDLGAHTYADPNLAAQARLLWGEFAISLEEVGTRSVAPSVEIVTFLVQPDPAAMQVRVKLKVAGLVGNHQVRVDGDLGQANTVRAGADGGQSHEWLFSYPKPGTYRVTVDLLDSKGYPASRLAESPVQMAEPVDFPPSVPLSAQQPFGKDAPAPPLSINTTSISTSTSTSTPWLPLRYGIPLFDWAKTYITAGGSTLSRSLAPGTYLAVRAETYVGGQRWYQTGSYDWILASSVRLFVTSELRGVELGVEPTPAPTPTPTPTPTPPPAPTPDPTPAPGPQPIKRGVVTANRLNVRAQPGTGANNPAMGQVTLNTGVDIFEERSVAGALWFRIGVDRWVHSGWVRVTETVTAAPPPAPVPVPDPEPTPAPAPTPEPDPQPIKQGRVTANRLNVRAQPGVSANNPAIDQVT
ncbi:MAG: SH3 domain-containing protein, partial [Caldilineaceae bacterium]|nr:SH3 domain-containing protein [Caldilineaceae bacterium]